MVYQTINSSYQGFHGWVAYVNDQSGGVMLPFFLLGVWIIMLVIQLEYGFVRSYLTSTFIISILAILLTVIGFLSPVYMYASFVMVGIGILLARLNFTP